MLSWVDAGRIVAGMGADLEQRGPGIRQPAVVLQAPSEQAADSAERAGRRHRIGGVGGYQQRRIIAPPQRPLEIGRDLDREQDLARRQRVIEFRLVAQLPHDLEIFGVAQRRKNRAADVAVFLQQHRGRQIARRGVDGVAEQHELHQRNRDHGRERDAVAPELEEFLDQHGAGAAPEAGALAGGRSRRGALIGNCPAFAHQIDEHVLERRLRAPPRQRRLARDRARSLLRARRRRGPRRAGWSPNGATISTPGLPPSSTASCEDWRSSPVTV